MIVDYRSPLKDYVGPFEEETLAEPNPLAGEQGAKPNHRKEEGLKGPRQVPAPLG